MVTVISVHQFGVHILVYVFFFIFLKKYTENMQYTPNTNNIENTKILNKSNISIENIKTLNIVYQLYSEIN